MSARVASPVARDDKRKSRSPQTKSSGRKSGSASSSPVSNNLATLGVLQPSGRSAASTPNPAPTPTTAQVPRNRSENTSFVASLPGQGSNRAGANSFAGTSTGNNTALASPNAVALLSVEQDFLQAPQQQQQQRQQQLPYRKSASQSNMSSMLCTPGTASLATTHRDPVQDEPIFAQTAREGGRTSQPLGGKNPIRKQPPLRRAAASQPNMINTSPNTSNLEAAQLPPPRAAAAAPKAVAKGSPAAEAPLVKQREKSRTPSPQPHVPPPKTRTATMTPSVAAAAATTTTPSVATTSPAQTPLLTRLSPSPQPAAHAKAKTKTSPPPQPKAGSAASAAAAAKTWSPPMNTHESPESLPTDAPNVLVPARKYAYDVKTCTWKEVEVMIRVLHPNRGVSQGAMRVCFVVDELDERGFSTPMVAKMFRHNLEGIVQEDYFNEGEAQCVCGIFAEKFNKLESTGAADRFIISFLQCDTVRIRQRDLPEEYQNRRSGFFSYRPTDSRDVLFTMEPRLKGNFTKYTNNYGAVYEGFEQRLDREKEAKRHKVLMSAEAFSHFTLEDSGGSMLVCDLQGVNDFLTDPQIHTEDGKGFGMGNMGQRGIDKWVEKHQCNEMCRALMLTPLSGPVRRAMPSSTVETRVSYYKILRSNLRSQAPTRPEDLIPLPKPLSSMTDEERLDYAIRLSQLMS